MPRSQYAIVKPNPRATIAIWVVKPEIAHNEMFREEAKKQFAAHFKLNEGVEIALAWNDADGHLNYVGRGDVVQWLSMHKREDIPWKEEEIN